MFKLLRRAFRSWLILGVWLLLAVGQSSHAGQSPVPDAVDDRAEITPTLYYLEDAHGELNFEAVRKEPQHWQKSSRATGNFGYTSSVFWFRIDLTNATSTELSKLLEVRAPYLDQIDYYLLRNDQLMQSGRTGDHFPFSQRLMPHPNYLFPLELKPQASYSLIFRVQEDGPIEFPVGLWNERDLQRADAIAMQLHSMYYGILLFVILFNLFIYYSLREKTYLYYVLFTASMLLVQSTLHGRSFQFLWPNLPALQLWLILVCVPSTIVFGLLFARHFLHIDDHNRVLTRCYQWVTAAGILCIGLLPFLPSKLSLIFSALVAIPASLLLAVSGPLLWWRGVREARFFTLAWLGLSLGFLSAVLYKHGVIPASLLTLYGLEFSSGLETILLSIAIVDRIYHERVERIKEINQRLGTERRLLEQATRNAVTGLPNRVLFENRLQKLIGAAEDQHFMVCLIHLSRFHEIDKTLGRENADRLLRQTANRLSEFCKSLEGAITLETREGQAVCLASAEGVVMGLLLLLQDHQTSGADPRILQLQEEIRQNVEFDHLVLDLGARIGIVRYPTDAKTIEELMRKAHIALDHASREQDVLAFYDKQFDVYNERRLTLMAELDKAIRHDKLELHFQPQLDLQQNRITGVETLVRWNHPEHGFIPPDEFVPLAEQTGVISALTRWVIRNALQALKQVHEQGYPLHFSINISAVNLKEPAFSQQVAALLQEFEVCPQDVMLELTETAMMDHPARAQEELRRLKGIGVQLSIDDFGTGYSSLSYINRLPIDELKIDKSLIFDLTTRADDQVIVKTTLEMAHNLGYRVVAEGVENQDVLDILTNLECDLIQGYFLARPMPLPRLLAWLAEREQLSEASKLSREVLRVPV